MPPASAPEAADHARRSAGSIAALIFALSAPSIYVLLRLYEQARGMHSDPTLILRALHTAYFWRALIAAWSGGLVAAFAFALLVRSRDAPAATLAQRLRVAALMLVPALAVTAYLRP